MPLIPDQSRQKNYKKYEPELQLKQDTSKQLFADPTEIWGIKATCEGDNLTSGNESDPEDYESPVIDKIVHKKTRPKLLPHELYGSKTRFRKNVRFGDGPCSHDIDPYDFPTQKTDHYERYFQHGRRMMYPDLEISDLELERTDERYPCRYRKNVILEPRPCLHRPKSSPAKIRSEFESLTDLPCRMLRNSKTCDRDREFITSKQLPCYEEDYECYDCEIKKNLSAEKNRRSQDHVHQVYTASVYQNENPCCHQDEYEHIFTGQGTKGIAKKKVLHNYEELPAVDEQQECYSDSNLKIPYSQYVSVVTPDKKIPKKKSDLIIGDSSHPTEWIFHPKKTIMSDLNKKLAQEIYFPKRFKMRSMRTRLNKVKEGWKRAVVHTIRDGSRRERVGLIVLGPKGPEFYSRASRKAQGVIPFRKTRSFPEGPTGSYDISINPECDKIFASSSEPGANTFIKNDDPLPLQETTKIEERICDYSKNVDQIVKSTENKFFKNLANDESKDLPPSPGNNNVFKKTEAETLQSDEKEKSVEELLEMDYPPFHLLPFDKLSPKVPKPIKNSSESSKTIARSLNEQAKTYRTNQEDKGKTDSDGKYPSRKKSKESVEANVNLWGMKSENLKETNDRRDLRRNPEEKSKGLKDEESQAGSVKSNEQININMQRRKRYYESTTTSKNVSNFYNGGKKYEENYETGSETKNKDGNDRKALSNALQDLVNNGCSISEKESENLQNIIQTLEEMQSEELLSSSSEKCRDDSLGENEMTRKADDTENESNFQENRKFRNRFREEERDRGDWTNDYRKSQRKSIESYEGFSENANTKKVSKLKEFKGDSDDGKGRKKSGRKSAADGRMEKMKFLREALPSLAAENEATHLKQLKKYLHWFTERAEHRHSSSSETKGNKKIKYKIKDNSSSTDGSEVKVDAKKIIDIVSHPFKKIASDMTINIARTLTDVLVQENSSKSPKNISTSTKLHKDSENETEENSIPYCTTMGSDRCEETEPTYLKQLKKMRNDHLNNIVMEVKRLNELLRYSNRLEVLNRRRKKLI